MGKKVEELGRAIRQAGQAGGQRVLAGVTTATPTAGTVPVRVGPYEYVATIPGSFRAEVKTGMDVRIVSTGTGWELQSVLSSLPTPTVDGTQGAWGENAWPAPQNFTGAGYSNSGFTAQDWEIAEYAEYVRGYVVDHSWYIGDLGDRLDAVQERLDQIHQLLIDQGHAL